MPRTPNETVARRASRPPAPAQKPELLAREVQPPVVTGTEGDDSRTAIALARCEREARCKNVGADREYVTEEDCIARLEPDTERELEARECPRSIAPARLGACMQAIREESCDRPRDLAPIDACGAAALCPKN